MLANRFYLPIETLEKANELEPNKRLPIGTMVTIPVNKDNYSTSMPTLKSDEYRELFYKVGEKDDIGIISNFVGVQKKQIILWNGMKGNTVYEDQALFIGWIKTVPKDSLSETIGLAYPIIKKTLTDAANIVPDSKKQDYGGLDLLYDQQTNHGTNLLTEKGTVIFFDKSGKGNVQYAFHNTAQRGSIIKVFNPGTGKVLYVKVIGPIPDTKQYANAIIGISSGAKEALGVIENKAWCELSYPAN